MSNFDIDHFIRIDLNQEEKEEEYLRKRKKREI